jgi:hypothetical protein
VLLLSFFDVTFFFKYYNGFHILLTFIDCVPAFYELFS